MQTVIVRENLIIFPIVLVLSDFFCFYVANTCFFRNDTGLAPLLPAAYALATKDSRTALFRKPFSHTESAPVQQKTTELLEEAIIAH